jgi:hypothetical protein
MTKIKIKFAPAEKFRSSIKFIMKNSNPNEVTATSVLQVAAHFEDFVATNPKAAPALSKKIPLADLTVHPEKVEAALKIVESAEQVAVAAKPAKGGAAREAISRKRAASAAKKTARQPTRELKNIEFFLEVPSAHSVKLAADFTDWEKSPVELSQSKDGIWHAAVPLSPGEYFYRFIVDGEWHDDPRPVARVSNPFGTSDAVLRVD